jgi:hypoxanthine phosphoribosyltransferase
MEPRPPRPSASPSERRLTRPESVPSTPPSGNTAASPTEAPSVARATPFAHASEAEFARILDFYGVRWEYEPHTFPILWNLDAGVAESFSPDFWLPDLELYVELTTLRQSLVRKKNRKLRRLRELYPDVRVKLFYGRDFRALMLKYGKLGLVEGLTGAPGQSSLIRPVGAVDEPLQAPGGESAPPLVGPSGPRVVQPEPTVVQVGADLLGLEAPAVDASAPSTAANEDGLPAAAASRSARRRRRRRAAAQLRRRAQVEESGRSANHEPTTRR